MYLTSNVVGFCSPIPDEFHPIQFFLSVAALLAPSNFNTSLLLLRIESLLRNISMDTVMTTPESTFSEEIRQSRGKKIFNSFLTQTSFPIKRYQFGFFSFLKSSFITHWPGEIDGMSSALLPVERAPEPPTGPPNLGSVEHEMRYTGEHWVWRYLIDKD